MISTRLLSAAFLSGLLAGPALADFNDQPPNAKGQSPAFQNQTRAPAIPRAPRLMRETLVGDLDQPWGMAVLPDGAVLITEKPGQLRIYRDGQLAAPIKGLPKVDANGQGGLLDVAIGPDFAQTRQIWFTFAEPRGSDGSSTSVATAKLAADEKSLVDLRTIFQQQPAVQSPNHFGSRLAFDNDGMLFVTTGDRGYPPEQSLVQDLQTHLGKVLRIDPQTGKAAPGNPFSGGKGQPEIWSYGHRNMQGAAIDAKGRLWTTEHGPMGGDELNHPESGKNYGWPDVSYGVNYDGNPVTGGITAKNGTEQPVYYWDPVIAPSGMVFYDGTMFPDWQGDLLIGGLRGQALVRLKLENGRVSGEQRLDVGHVRVRDVAIAPDGAILILTDEKPGALLRLSKRGG